MIYDLFVDLPPVIDGNNGDSLGIRTEAVDNTQRPGAQASEVGILSLKWFAGKRLFKKLGYFSFDLGFIFGINFN